MNAAVDTQYEDLLRHVLAHGTVKADRTRTGTRSVSGHQMRFKLGRGFPLITTKREHFRSVAYELLWLLRGESNVSWLRERGVSIWDERAAADGDLGPVHGVQWRAWPTSGGRHIDQLATVLETLLADPDSRRMMVSAWNVGEIGQMALPPCHAFFQLYVADGLLSCRVYQRSADLFLGVPFNIASYALLTHLIALQVGLGVGDLAWTGGDCHLYDNHLEQSAEQLSRQAYRFPRLEVRQAASLFDYDYDDLRVLGHRHHPAIAAPVAV